MCLLLKRPHSRPLLYPKKGKGKGYGIRLYSPYRRRWSPFLGPSARKCNGGGGLGASHPVLSRTFPVYLPQISQGNHLELGRLWLSFQSRHWPPSQTEQLGTPRFEPASSQTSDPKSSAPTHSAKAATLTLSIYLWIFNTLIPFSAVKILIAFSSLQLARFNSIQRIARFWKLCTREMGRRRIVSYGTGVRNQRE